MVRLSVPSAIRTCCRSVQVPKTPINVALPSPLTYAAAAGPARSKTKLFFLLHSKSKRTTVGHFVLLSRGAKRYLSDTYAVPTSLFYIHRRYCRNLIFWGLIPVRHWIGCIE